jgi:hypothetical protein
MRRVADICIGLKLSKTAQLLTRNADFAAAKIN